MDNFNITKFFRKQYLAEGDWKEISGSDLEEYKDDINQPELNLLLQGMMVRRKQNEL